MVIWGKNIPNRGNIKGKGLERTVYLTYFTIGRRLIVSREIRE